MSGQMGLLCMSPVSDRNEMPRVPRLHGDASAM